MGVGAQPPQARPRHTLPLSAGSTVATFAGGPAPPGPATGEQEPSGVAAKATLPLRTGLFWADGGGVESRTVFWAESAQFSWVKSGQIWSRSARTRVDLLRATPHFSRHLATSMASAGGPHDPWTGAAEVRKVPEVEGRGEG
eukprot:gene22693-biopygen17756